MTCDKYLDCLDCKDYEECQKVVIENELLNKEKQENIIVKLQHVLQYWNSFK